MRGFSIEELDIATLSESDLASFAVLTNALQAEEDPDEPPQTVEVVARGLRVPRASGADNRDIVARDPQGILVGHAWMILSRDGSNEHIADVHLAVRPDLRRLGVGSALLAGVAKLADNDGRTLLMDRTSDHVPAGAAFARHLGAAPLLTVTENRLRLRDVDRALVERWIRNGPVRAPGYSLVSLDGPIPEAVVEAFVDLAAVMEEAPAGELDWEHERLTVGKLRAREARWAGQQRTIWTVIARHDASGTLAGYTQVLLQQDRPHAIIPKETGVRLEHRGRGLGKCLKATMLRRVMSEASYAVYIDTGNAASNAPMLAINEALGFRPFRTDTVWQVPIERVNRALV
jgi:mycothiol synthase